MLTLESLPTSYFAELRDAIEQCAARIATPLPPPAKEVFDRELLEDLGNQLGAALQNARANAQILVNAHHAHFPDSPLFCSCSLLRPLGQSRRELSVTQVLGWLFDPNAEHGFGGLLLRAFLSLLAEDSDEAQKIHESDDHDLSVYTEFTLNETNRADILIVCPGHAVVVEAKVDASEGQGQTERYHSDFGNSFPACTFVYLTHQGTQAISTAFRSLRYLELVRAMIRVLPAGYAADGFHYARYFLAGLLNDLCEIPTSNKVEEVLQGNCFKLEILLESKSHE
jgi:hypothetical protein